MTSPATAARQTASVLGLAARVEPALRDLDYGRWGGRTLDEVSNAEPDGVTAWLSDPAAVPHGGECVLALLQRVAAWLSALDGPDRMVAVTHAAVLRGAVLATLGASPAAFWQVEAGPLAQVRLRGARGRWVLLGCG